MAEELVETVDRLQSRLMESPEPRKLLKTLKRLGELPMTVDILVATGVGKIVNSFRKHEVAAEMAKNLVAKWKKLVPQSADSRSSTSQVKEAARSHSRSADVAVSRRRRDPSPDEEEDTYAEEEEERGYRTNYSPSPPRRLQYSPPQPESDQSDKYDSPGPEPEPSPSPPPPPRMPPLPRKHGKPSKADKNHHHHGDHSNRVKDSETRQRHMPTSCGDGKKRNADRERSPPANSAKHGRKSDGGKREDARKGAEAQADSPGSKEGNDDFETPTKSFESFLTYDAPTSSAKKKKKKSTPASSSSHARAATITTKPTSSRRDAQPPASSSLPSSSKKIKANGVQSTKRSHSGASSTVPEKRKRVVEAVLSLPEIPLPDIQPDYRPLPSFDITPLSPQRRKGPVFNDEEDAGFTGKRFNSKMVVYSGSKTAYLPRMMTLYEQCIRVLQNNIDSIDEVGGVPFEILGPVLERCTPEQLYRIEQSNQWFIEDSNELWMRHCQRDFKRETPQEYESWREMYLRLHDEREARLRRLTQNISMAHANKPKERQVKMAYVNSVAKPPRDVRRRQERFGTSNGSSADSVNAATPIKIRPATDYSGRSSPPSSSSSLLNTSPGSSQSPALSAGALRERQALREKPQVKKIAPMMAKTIKAFKNRFSRR
ncbi:elongin-A [Syngnathus typhle]|uniref:elongin-A n=1 Tax=Syngnathus typhle TaxID=161592 RepID=UPI002A6B6731|nr:elongin-A [Syngnathus typhle]